MCGIIRREEGWEGEKKHKNGAKSKSEDRQSEIREEDAGEAYEEMEVVETRNANGRF